MKTGSALILAMIFILAFDGCKKEVLPTAGFTYAPSDVVQYEEVQFTNSSSDADSYLWDFGNNQVSTEANPKVVFMTEGAVTVKLTATNGDGSNLTEQTIVVNAPDNHYMLDDVRFDITTDMFWYSAMGSTYIRLLTYETEADTLPDLLKLYPNYGIGELPGTYTWLAKGDTINDHVGTYDFGYTAKYAGMAYDWTSIGKTGSADLVIQEVETGVYKITGDNMILSVGTYDWSTGEFTETGTKLLTLNYVGAITPLP